MTVRAEVPFGETVTYGEVAEMIGPAAGRACRGYDDGPQPGAVPDPVPSRGRRERYRWVRRRPRAAIALKRALLDLEGRARPTG